MRRGQHPRQGLRHLLHFIFKKWPSRLSVLSHLPIPIIHSVIANLGVVLDSHCWRDWTAISYLAAAPHLAVDLEFITISDVTRTYLTAEFEQVVVPNLHCLFNHIILPVSPWLIHNSHMVLYDAVFAKYYIASLSLDCCIIVHHTPFSEVNISNNVSFAANHNWWRLFNSFRLSSCWNSANITLSFSMASFFLLCWRL